MAGIVGAIFNSGIELGAAVGLAVDISIEASVEQKQGGFFEYNGRRATLWWQIATIAVEAIAVIVFYRTRIAPPPADEEASAEKTQDRSRTLSPVDDMKDEKERVES